MLNLFTVSFFGKSFKDNDNDLRFLTEIELEEELFNKKELREKIAKKLLNLDYADEIQNYDIEYLIFSDRKNVAAVNVKWSSFEQEYTIDD